MATDTKERDARLTESLLQWDDVRGAPLPTGQRTAALQRLLELALQLCDGDSGSLMVVDSQGRHLLTVVSRGLRVDPRELPAVPLGEPIAGRIAQRGHPVLLSSEQPAAGLANAFRRREEIRTSACVPVRRDGSVYGLLNVNQRWNGKRMDEGDLSRLRLLVNYATEDIVRLTSESAAGGEAEVRWMTDPDAQTRIDRLANLGVVAGGIAHQISNPVQSSLGLVELLVSSPDLSSDDARQDLAALRTQIVKLAEIVSCLLSFVRGSAHGAGGVTPHVGEAIDFAIRAARTQYARADIECRRICEPDLPPVRIAPQHLQQVLLNLAVNAVQSMGRQGVLSVHARRADSMVEIAVTDNGPGIAPADLERIFEPGYTTKAAAHGTGLGLPVSRRIVRDSGGDLVVHSPPEGGATFVVRLRIADG